MKKVLFLLLVLSIFGARAQVSQNFIDLTVHNAPNLPTAAGLVQFGTIRGWDTGTTMNVLNPSSGTFVWTALDAFLNSPTATSKDLIYTFGYLPTWMSSNPTGACTQGPTGTCYPPSDIGSGNTNFSNFVTALVNHSLASKAAGHGYIRYYEVWNEPNATDVGSTSCPPSCGTWYGTIAQFNTMVATEYSVIHSLDPNAQLIGPALSHSDSTSNITFLNDFLSASGSKITAVSGHHYDGYFNPVFSMINDYNDIITSETGAGLSLPVWYTEGNCAQASVNPCTTDAQKIAVLGSRYLSRLSLSVARDVYYAFDGTHGDNIWVSGSGLTPEGVAYGQLSSWLVGATGYSCTTNGNSGSTLTTWRCSFTQANGQPAQILFLAGNNAIPSGSTLTASAGTFTHSQALGSATINSVSGGNVTVSTIPLMLTPTPVPPPAGNSWYVSPTGSSINSGTSPSSPWDLCTAIGCTGAAPKVIQPGDTIWLAGGTYTPPNSDNFISHLNGTYLAPIIVRNITVPPAGYTGQLTPEGYERAIINGNGLNAFNISGSYTWIWGLESADLTVLTGNRYLTNLCAGCSASFYPPAATGMEIMGPGNRAIHCVVHDNAAGLYSYALGSNVEEYGNITYYNGYLYGAQGLGHGFYQQNTSGTKYLTNNFAFDNVDNGFQIYGSNGAVLGFHTAGNASFDNGSLAAWQYNLVMGSAGGNGQNYIDSFFTYFPLTLRNGYVTVGQYDPMTNISDTNNVFVGGYTTVQSDGIAGPSTFSGNRLVNVNSNSGGAPSAMVIFSQFTNQNLTGMVWNNNNYYGGPNLFYKGFYDGNNLSGGSYVPFANWQANTGFDSSSTFTTTLPTGNWQYVLPDKYTTKRANVIIYNWDAYSDQAGDIKSPCTGACAAVSVDLSSVLSPGDQYTIKDVQCWFCAPMATGTYSGGTVSFPMIETQARPIPWGLTHAPAYSFPAYGAFVVFSNASADIPQGPSTPTGLQITTGALPGGTVNQSYNYTLQAQGGTAPYTWTWTGMPGVLTLNSSTGAISGTPTAAGSFTAVVTVTDSASPTHAVVTQSFPVTISSGAPPPPPVVALFTIGQLVAVNSISSPASVRSTGVTNSSILGTEPNAAIGTVTNGPNPIPPTGTAADILWQVNFPGGSSGGTALQGWVWQSLLVASGPPATLAPPSALTATTSVSNVILNWSETTVGVTGFNVYRGTVQAGPFTKIASPTALTYTDASGLTPGTYYYYVTSVLTVESQPSGTVSATIAATAPPLSVSASNFPNGVVGTAYTGALTITGGVPPYVFSATGSAPGLTVAPSTGTLSGTPTGSGGTYTSAYSIHDSTTPTPLTITPSFTYMIAAAPPPPPPQPPNPPSGLMDRIASMNVVLNWTASVSTGVTSYNVRRTNNPAAIEPWSLVANVTGTTYTDLPPMSGTYYYQVTALIGTLEGNVSNTATAQILNPPNFPPAADPGILLGENRNARGPTRN